MADPPGKNKKGNLPMSTNPSATATVSIALVADGTSSSLGQFGYTDMDLGTWAGTTIKPWLPTTGLKAGPAGCSAGHRRGGRKLSIGISDGSRGPHAGGSGRTSCGKRVWGMPGSGRKLPYLTSRKGWCASRRARRNQRAQAAVTPEPPTFLHKNEMGTTPSKIRTTRKPRLNDQQGKQDATALL